MNNRKFCFMHTWHLTERKSIRISSDMTYKVSFQFPVKPNMFSKSARKETKYLHKQLSFKSLQAVPFAYLWRKRGYDIISCLSPHTRVVILKSCHYWQPNIWTIHISHHQYLQHGDCATSWNGSKCPTFFFASRNFVQQLISQKYVFMVSTNTVTPQNLYLASGLTAVTNEPLTLGLWNVIWIMIIQT